jgi:hypothetical protein
MFPAVGTDKLRTLRFDKRHYLALSSGDSPLICIKIFLF